MMRLALKDFEFSNGIKIPAGTIVSAAPFDTEVDEVCFVSFELDHLAELSTRANIRI